MKCKGCSDWRKLDKLYGKKDWEKHKKICAQISGIERK